MKKSVVRDIFLILLNTLFLLLILEALVRLFAPQRDKMVYVNGKPMVVKDSILGFRLNPGSHSRQKFREFTADYIINKEGFRSGRPLLSDTTARRILFIGDSFVFGMGNNLENHWLTLLEQRINAGENPPWQLINSGVPGYNPVQEALAAQHLIPAFKPETVVMMLVPGDLHEMEGLARNNMLQDVGEDRPNIEIQENKAPFFSLQLASLVEHWLIRNDQFYLAISRSRDFPQFEYLNEENLELADEFILDIARQSREAGARFVLCYVPVKSIVIYLTKAGDGTYREQLMGIEEHLQRLSKVHDFRYISALDTFLEDYREREKDQFYRLDDHLNRYGNQLLTEYLFTEFKKQKIIN